MDKYEYAVRTDKLRKMADRGDYASAVKIADAIDWSRVNDTRLLQTVADAYEKVGRYREARETLLNAYEQVPVGRRMVYKLTELAVKEGNLAEAEEYFSEFQEIAPNDTGKFVLRYEISAAKGEPLSKQISILEAYKRREFEEKWAYELAELYQKADRKDDCIHLCDEIIVWFGEGEYVNKAKALKEYYGIYTAESGDSALPPIKEEQKHGITEQWNVAALQQEQELSKNLADMMKDEAGYADPEFDEEGFAAKLGKTKEVKLPIVPEATRELNDIHQALAYAGEVIPALDLDVIKEAAEEEHQKYVTEHRRWDLVYGEDVNGQKKMNAKTAEFIPDRREALPDDTDEIVPEEKLPEEKLPEDAAADGKADPEKEEEDKVDSLLAALDAGEAKVPDKTLEDILKEAQDMLSDGSEEPELNLESALSAAEEKTGEVPSAPQETAGDGGAAYDRRPKMSAPDSVVNMLEEEKEAAYRAKWEEEKQKKEAVPEAPAKEEVVSEAAPDPGDVTGGVLPTRTRAKEIEQIAKEKPMAVNSDKSGVQAASASGKKPARCAFLEASDESTRTERAMESIRKLHDRLGTEVGRAARVQASRLNERGVAATFRKLDGRDLIVENASELERAAVEDLANELKTKNEDNVIVLVDTASGIQKLIPSCDALRGICSYIREKAGSQGEAAAAPAQGGQPKKAPESAGKSPSRSSARKNEPQAEMSMRDFAKCIENYAHQLECELDDKAGLAIYARAEQLMDDGIALTEAVAKDITDDAVALAEKPSLRGVFSGKYNKDGYLILREDHFMRK